MRWARYLGLASPLVGYFFIILAILLNSSWFSITHNAISDLGSIVDPRVNHPWVLSAGLIMAGAGMSIFTLYAILKVENTPGLWLYLAGMLSLMLIGVFPEGTGEHWYVSISFFLLSSFGILLYGIWHRTTRLGKLSILIFALGWILGIIALLSFPGVAIAEIIGSLSITIWLYIFIWENGL